MKVGVIGSGTVGQVLANGFLRHGHEVRRGSRDPAKLAAWARDAGPQGGIGTFAEAAAFGELVVLAVKGSAALAAAEACGAALDGKPVIDCTNPIADAPPADGVLPFFTQLDGSLMEQLQQRHPRARWVKAFSCVGSGLMVNPRLAGGPPTMFICGDDDAAKRLVGRVLDQFGWATEDLGGVRAARAIEPLCILWCIPGFRQNDWVHALKLLRP